MAQSPVEPASADTESEANGTRFLIRRVGERVRSLRMANGLSRGALSERSGVSTRYLAQLEAGLGNISIGLLQRVAAALGHRVEGLLAEEEPLDTEGYRVARLYRDAPETVRQSVLEMLSAKADLGRRARRICLVGLRGAGKSTLGAAAGRALGIPFVELNREIEMRAGIPVSEVMALYGQEGYRRLEADALSRIVATHDTLILAVAGGIVGTSATYEMLLDRFHTIWLRATPEDHMRRVRAQGDERPMAGHPEAMAELRSILRSREDLYARANAELDTSERTVPETLKELLRIIHEKMFLGYAP